MSKRSLALLIALVILGGMATAIAARKRAIARMPPPSEAAIPVRTAFARDGQAGGSLTTVAWCKPPPPPPWRPRCRARSWM